MKYFQGGVPRHQQTEVVRSGEQQQSWLRGWSVRQTVGESSWQPGRSDLRHAAQVEVALSSPHLPGEGGQRDGGQTECHHLTSSQGQQ